MADKFGQLNENDTKILLDKSVPKSTEREICTKNFFGNFACESDKFTEKYHFLNNSLSVLVYIIDIFTVAAMEAFRKYLLMFSSSSDLFLQ